MKRSSPTPLFQTRRIFPGLPGRWLFCGLALFAWAGPLPARGQTPAPPASSASAAATDLSLSPQEEIQVLDAIDAQSNTASAGSPQVKPGKGPAAPVSAAADFALPPAPTGLSSLILKEGVYLSWDAAPASQAAAYNVYRSTTPGEGYRLVNLRPLPAPYFLDGPPNSLSPPQNGEDYFYVVASIDPGGNVSPYSDEVAVNPQGMDVPPAAAATAKASPTPGPEEEKELVVPQRNLLSLQLPADSQLSIQGYKKIEAQFNFQKFNRPDQQGGVPAEADTTTVNQELVVNLQGKVGKNVDVNVDYSDVNRAGGVDQSKQDISIVYHGNPDSAVQEVAFGNLALNLPNTEFAGFSKQLFGLQAKVKFDNFRFTSFFAQTQGISETKIFKGNSVQVDTNFQDTNYIPYKYFLITREILLGPPGPGGQPTNLALPQPNSDQVWVDAGTGLINPIGPNFGGPNNAFEHWLPGRDYTMDYSTGVITFLRALGASARIAVGFTNQAGQARGLNLYGANSFSPAVPPNVFFVPDDGWVGVADLSHNVGVLLKDNNNSTLSSAAAVALSPLYLVNAFNLGTQKIIPPDQDPDFQFQVVSQGTNNVLQTGQGVSQVGSTKPWIYNINLDLNLLTVSNFNFTAAGSAVSFLFPERPFANLDPSGGTGTNDVYSQTTPPTSLYFVHLHYKTQLDFFNLNRINIIRGSEAVFLDGRRLRRDTDYFLDYTSGFLDFQDKSLLRTDSQIVVTYEYSPFGSFGQNNILGARAEYDVNDHFFIGSTFLEDDSQQPIDVPQVGSTPNSLSVLDADAQYTLGPEDIQSITGILPGLENWKPPVNIKLSGEIAKSFFNPDTFNAEGETGVAMIDNMEGIDNEVNASTNSSSWLVSAAPQPVAFLGNESYVSGPVTANNRVRFYNNSASPTLMDFETIGTLSTPFQAYNGTQTFDSAHVPAYGGHLYATTQNPLDSVGVLQFPYSDLNSQAWAGVRTVLSSNGTDLSNAKYFQTWLYNDGNDKWIMFDFGITNEDANGNGVLDHDPGQNAVTQTVADTAYGIPTFYMPGTPWYNANGFIGYPGTGSVTLEVSQEGQGVGAATNYVTEDMNANNLLESGNSYDNYFEYGVRANWSGWRQVNIPVNYAQTDIQTATSDGISYFFHTQGTPNPTVIRTVRVWATGTSASKINGDFWLENISFTQNLWQLQVDPKANVDQGVTVNTSKFNVSSVSHDQNPSYQGNLRFITIQAGQDQNSIQSKEKSLQINYNLSSADLDPQGDLNGRPIYYATRVFSQGLDFTDYQQVRMDLQIKSFNPGEVLFVRLGNDQQDYYQYNVPLTSASLNTWNTITIPIDGSKGNRSQMGTPYLNRTTQVSFGVLSPNPPGGVTGVIWIDNLRAVSPNVRSGLARRLNAAMVLGDNFATVNGRYREVDSGFTEMDQTTTHFQHSTQVGADFSSPSGVKLFGQPLSTQFSWTRQDLYTEAALKDNPYYISLPNSHIESATGSIGYSKDLGKDFGRLTNLRLSGSSNYENDTFEPLYLTQPGVQGNTRKGQEIFTLASTYDAPTRFFFLPIGTNQFNGTFSLTHDLQQFLPPNNLALAPYDRTTRAQTYSWTNTTELVKNLVFTPGYTLSLTDAMGNTNSPGIPGAVPNFTPFLDRYQPKGGLVYRGIPGVIPSVDYSGSNQYDFVSFQDGTRFSSANNINYSLNLTPGSWFAFFQKINLTVFAGRTESSSAQIPAYSPATHLTFDQRWLTDTPFGGAYLGTRSIAHQLNASFRLFDAWDFRPTGSWNDQLNLLSQGTNPVRQTGETLGLTTVYNRKIFTLPFLKFSLDSAQVQFTHTDNRQYDSSTPPQLSNQNTSDLYSLTLPYDINQQAQGKIFLQRTQGYQNGLTTSGVGTAQLDDQGSIEYDQKFAPNLAIHIPFTHWVLKLHDAIEFQAIFFMEFVNNRSSYVYNQLETQKYRGSINFNYNALTNLRVGLGLANEYFTNTLNPQLGYTLWQGTISAEARF